LLGPIAIVLEEGKLILEAKLTLEELNIFYIFKLLRLGGRFPRVGGLGLHETDVFLALLDLPAVEEGTVALDHAALDDLGEQRGAQIYWKMEVTILAGGMHIEL
jgi:hypothetical protein